MKKVIRINENDIEKLVKKIIGEDKKRHGLWANIRAKRARGEAPARKGSEAYKKAVESGKKINAETDNMDDYESSRYMFFSNLQQIKRQCEYLLEFDESQIEEILEDGHDWAQDHIAEAKNNMDQVFDFLMNEIKGDGDDYDEDYDEEDEEEQRRLESYIEKYNDRILDIDEFGFTELLPITEAKGDCANRGLSKPWSTPDGPKKRSVCVKNGKGNVVKVNFGDPNMRIKKSNKKRRKSFRARHRCENPGPKWKARYWSCRAW